MIKSKLVHEDTCFVVKPNQMLQSYKSGAIPKHPVQFQPDANESMYNQTVNIDHIKWCYH